MCIQQIKQLIYEFQTLDLDDVMDYEEFDFDD